MFFAWVFQNLDVNPQAKHDREKKKVQQQRQRAQEVYRPTTLLLLSCDFQRLATWFSGLSNAS